MTLNSNQMLSGCKVIEKIAEGGMGEIYLAKDEKLNRRVAIKMMLGRVSNDQNDRFAREAEAMAKLNHPGIVQIYSYGEYEKSPYFVMEYVDGAPLTNFINKAKFIKTKSEKEINEYIEMGMLNTDMSLPYFLREPSSDPLKDPEYIKQVVGLISSLADSLFEAHQLGIIHRDIKPANIMITKEGRVKLTDFGIAKSSDQSELTGTQQWVGTLQYMAPEQFEGSKGIISPSTDIYALGLILYELLTLEHPIKETDPAAIMREIITADHLNPMTLNSGINSKLANLVMKCLEKKAESRYNNVEVLADELRLIKINNRTSSSFSLSNAFSNLFKSKKKIKVAKVKATSPEPVEEVPAKSETVEDYFKKLDIKFNHDVSDLDIELSDELVHDSIDCFVGEISASKSLACAKEALEYNPHNLDALMALAMAFRSVGSPGYNQTVNKICNLIYDNASEVDKLKIDLFRYSILETNYKKALPLFRKFKKMGGNELLFFEIEANYYYIQGNVKKAIEVAEEMYVRYPQYCLIPYMVADYKESIGEVQEAINLINKLIEKFPQVSNLYTILLSWHLNLGNFEEVKSYSKKIEETDPSNPFGPASAGISAAFDKDYKNAIKYYRKAAGLTNFPGMQANYYYNIYRIYQLLSEGEKDRGVKYLEIAQNLDPKYNYRADEEWEQLYLDARIDIFKNVEISNNVQDILVEKIKKYFISCLAFVRYFGNSLRVNYYEIDELGNTKFYYISGSRLNSLLEDSRQYMYLPHVPFGAVFDVEGNVVKASFKKIEMKYGNILAEIVFNPTSLRNGLFLKCMQMDGSELSREDQDSIYFKSLDYPEVRPGMTYEVVRIPKTMDIQKLSIDPDEILDMDEYQLLFFKKFLFQDQVFNVEMKLKNEY